MAFELAIVGLGVTRAAYITFTQPFSEYGFAVGLTIVIVGCFIVIGRVKKLRASGMSLTWVITIIACAIFLGLSFSLYLELPAAHR